MKALLPFIFVFVTSITFGQPKSPRVQKSSIILEETKLKPKIGIIDGSFFLNLKSKNLNVAEIQNNLNDWLGLSKDHSFVEISKTEDNLGFTHQHFQQFYKGIPVNESAVLLHSKNGIATSINGSIVEVENFDVRASITSALAKSSAMTDLNANKFIKEYPIELVVLKIKEEIKSEVKLAYKVRIDASDPMQMFMVFVDAISRKVIQKINLINHADEPGTAQTLYSGVKPITVDNNQGTFRLRETGRKIETYNATGSTFNNALGFQNYADYTNPTATWSTANPGLDAHWGMEKTFDFYLETFNRNSYNNLGSPIKNFVNGTTALGSSKNNAFALTAPYNVLVYGLGDGITYSPLVSLDVVGHEFSHLVIENNGNGGLTYLGESGALNESFADIFGIAVEFYADPNGNWTLGEDIVLKAPFYLRSMSNPNSGFTPQPDTYKGSLWKSTSANFDSGGVHYNSGVQNYWFYLLSEGGVGTNDFNYNYNVQAIGRTKALQIAYRNLTTYLTAGANYSDARNGSLQATEDLFGAGSTEYAAVLEAWNAVNVGATPLLFCSGTTLLTDSTGVFSDNSGDLEYDAFADCKWVIAPQGAVKITLNFTTFKTEAGYDFVTVYNGPDTTSPVLGTFSGSSLPPAISTSLGVGAMCIKFTSDFSISLQGWSASYTSLGLGSCVESPTFTAESGTISDGSGSNNYGNNQYCRWLIAPPCASSVSISFTELDTELNKDTILIFDNAAATNLIATISGNVLPNNIVSTTGVMAIHFVTNFNNPMQGFTVNYNSITNLNDIYLGSTTRSFCTSAKITDLSQGNTKVKWFATDSGGTPLASTTSLVNGANYYATYYPSCDLIPRVAVFVTIIPKPVLAVIPDVNKCFPITYTLPTLVAGNYFTGSNGSGNQLIAGDVISTSQKIYVYAESILGSSCSSQTSFYVNINNCSTPYYGEDYSICKGSNPQPLSTYTDSGVSGTWSPSQINNMETTTYTFTPTQDGYYLPITLTITVDPIVIPEFDQVPPICPGGDIYLSSYSNNGIDGEWTPALNNMETTTYTFTPYYWNCASPTSMTIEVLSAGTISGGNVTVCAVGTALNLSGVSTAFTNSTTLTLNDKPAGSTVQWQRSNNYESANPTWSVAYNTTTTNNNVSINGSTLTVSNLLSTIWYRVKVTNGTCVTYATPVKITVNPVARAGAITGAASVCYGSDITFTSAAFAGSSIAWELSTTSSTTGFEMVTGANGLTFTMSNITYAPLSKFYVRSVVTSGDCTIARSSVRTVTVNPSVAIAGTVTGAGIFCAGSNATLRISNYTGTIQWMYSVDGSNFNEVPYMSTTLGYQNPTGASTFTTTSLNGRAGSYAVNNITGTTYFKAIVKSGTCSTVESNVVVFNTATSATAPSLSVESASICIGTATSIYLPLNIGNVRFQKSNNWSSGTPTWTTVNLPMTQALYNGAYGAFSTGALSTSTAYRVSASIGTCAPISYGEIAVIGVVDCTINRSIETTDEIKTPFTVVSYPNPSNNVFNFKINGANDDTISILVFDMLGKQIENKVVRANEIENISLGQNYASGIYNVIVSQGMNTKSVRLVKK